MNSVAQWFSNLWHRDGESGRKIVSEGKIPPGFEQLQDRFFSTRDNPSEKPTPLHNRMRSAGPGKPIKRKSDQ